MLFEIFKLTGVDLNEAEQKEFAQISAKLSELTSKFSNNVLDATHGYTLHVTDKDKLKGLPESALKLASAEASERKLDGYVFTLEMPSYLPL